MKSLTDILSGFVLLGLCAVGAWSIGTLPEPSTHEHLGPGSFPTMILVLLAVCSLILLIKGFRGVSRTFWPDARTGKKVAVFLGLFYLYILVLITLGDYFANMAEPIFEANGAFCISTFLFLVTALPLLGRRKIVEVLSVAVLTTGILVGSFGWFFQVILP